MSDGLYESDQSEVQAKRQRAMIEQLNAQNQTQSHRQLGSARQQAYKPPFMLTISKPNNGFSVVREDGQQYVFTDPNRLLAYIREAIGLPMNEVSAADSGILLEEEMVEDAAPEKNYYTVHDLILRFIQGHEERKAALKAIITCLGAKTVGALSDEKQNELRNILLHLMAGDK